MTSIPSTSSRTQLQHLQQQSVFSSEDSKLFGLRLRGLTYCSVKCGLNWRPSVVVMRFGGGGSRGSYGGRRAPPPPADEDDPALNISSIKSATVRLIDAGQNMVGLVSKSEAIRIAENTELDLICFC